MCVRMWMHVFCSVVCVPAGSGLNLDWISPDAVCRSGPSPASPHRCTHKAGMAQPRKIGTSVKSINSSIFVFAVTLLFVLIAVNGFLSC